MEKPGPPRPPSRLERWLVAWVAFAIRRERTVLLTVALLTLGLGLYAALHLGVNMDNKTTLLSADLPFQERARDFEAHFPLLNDALLVVVDGPSPDRAREAARRLASQLERRPDLARSVFLADADPFFERHALLYRSVEELESFSDQMVRFQPVLGELARRPDLTTLTRLIRRTLDPASPPPPEELARLLDGFGDATVAVYAERPLHVSWQDLLLRESGFQTRRFPTPCGQHARAHPRAGEGAGHRRGGRPARPHHGLPGAQRRGDAGPADGHRRRRPLLLRDGAGGTGLGLPLGAHGAGLRHHAGGGVGLDRGLRGRRGGPGERDLHRLCRALHRAGGGLRDPPRPARPRAAVAGKGPCHGLRTGHPGGGPRARAMRPDHLGGLLRLRTDGLQGSRGARSDLGHRDVRDPGAHADALPGPAHTGAPGGAVRLRRQHRPQLRRTGLALAAAAGKRGPRCPRHWPGARRALRLQRGQDAQSRHRVGGHLERSSRNGYRLAVVCGPAGSQPGCGRGEGPRDRTATRGLGDAHTARLRARRPAGEARDPRGPGLLPRRPLLVGTRRGSKPCVPSTGRSRSRRASSGALDASRAVRGCSNSASGSFWTGSRRRRTRGPCWPQWRRACSATSPLR